MGELHSPALLLAGLRRCLGELHSPALLLADLRELPIQVAAMVGHQIDPAELGPLR